MLVLEVLAGLAVLFGVFAFATGRASGMSGAEPDRGPSALPEGRPLAASDLEEVRFSVGLRGYRMDEVDALLDRLAAEITARDERLAAEEQAAGREATDAPDEGRGEGTAWPSSW